MLKICKTFLWLTLLTLLNIPNCFSAPTDTLHIKPGYYEPKLKNFYSYFNNKTEGDLSYVLQELKQGHFSKLINQKSAVLNKNITNKSYWIALTIKNDTTIDFPVIWNFYEDGIQFTLYNINNTNQPSEIATYSTATPLDKRPLGIRCVSFKIQLPHQQTQQLLVKCKITTANSMYIPTDLSTIDDILLYEMGYNLLVGRYFGFFLFALLFNLLIWLFTNDKLHLWQFLYILSIIGFNLIEMLFDVLLLPEWLHHIVTFIPKYTFLACSFFCAIFVYENFTNLKKTFPESYRLLQYLKILLLLIIVVLIATVIPTSNYSVLMFTIRNGTTYACLFSALLFWIFIIVGCFKKDTQHLYYFISVAAILLGFISFVLNNTFHLMIFYIEPGNMMVGLAIELLLQTLFFTYRHKFIKNKVLSLETNLSQSVMTAQEEERIRISGDLHDQIGNDFLSLELLTAKLKNTHKELTISSEENILDDITKLVGSIKDNIRYITHLLAENNITEHGLYKVLYSRLKLINNNGQTIFQFKGSGNPDCITLISSITLYRIILESVSNILKHAQASKAILNLNISDTLIEYTITDNGKGFSKTELINGLGMQTMKKRTETMHGTFQVQSTISNGTTITISIPTFYHLK